MFAPGEHVRIVPLHSPKPSVTIDELGRLRGEEGEIDLFDGKPHVTAASAHLTYNTRFSRASRCSRSSGARNGRALEQVARAGLAVVAGHRVRENARPMEVNVLTLVAKR